MEFAELTPYTFIFLFTAGFSAGFIDSIAGGGGLIALPSIMFIGLPPQLALGTNKLQGTFGTFSALHNYLKKGHASLKETFVGIIFTLVGALGGSLIVQKIDASIIEPIIPVLLFIIFIYTLFSKKTGITDTKPKLNPHMFYIIFGLLLGFYDGFFGPGIGSLWTAAFMFFLGSNMTRATGNTKIMNFASNIVALLCFAAGKNIFYTIGFTMAVGQVLGAKLGSGMAIKKGAVFIRPVFLTIIFCTILRFLYIQAKNTHFIHSILN